MAWYDYINPLNQEKGLGGVLNQLGLNGPTPGDRAKMDRLNRVGSDAMGFAGQARNNYSALSGRLHGALDDLQAQARGENSVSALQLQQAQDRNLAAQRSMAASASPQNQAMAARTAAMQMGQLGYGLAGQQALAGLMERQQAQQAYASLLGQARGQDMQGTLGGYGAAAGAYGGGLNAQRDPTLAGQLAGGLAGAASLGLLGGGKGG